MKLIGHPCPSRQYISAKFGQVGDHLPVEGHEGVDFAGPQGTPILAAHEGVVRVEYYPGEGYGLLVRIQGFLDGMPLETRYAHLGEVTVKSGAWVRRGQRIAKLGMSGTDEPHLHFELWWQGARVDPLEYMEVESEDSDVG